MLFEAKFVVGSPCAPTGWERFLKSYDPVLAMFPNLQRFGLLKEKKPHRGRGWDLLASWASFLVHRHHVVQAVVNTVKGQRGCGLSMPGDKAQIDEALGSLIQHWS